MYKHINYRLIMHIIGNVLVFESVFIVLSIIISFLYNGNDKVALFSTFFITLFCGLILLMFSKGASGEETTRKDSFIAVTLSWIFLSVFGALPYIFSQSTPTIIDALFESVSGFTTTGSSVIPDVESLERGILFWRAETHWIGGMGIIVLVIAILPYYKIGVSNLLVAEGSIMGVERLKPRIIDTAKRLWIIYIVLTIAEIILLMIGGMSWYDAVCHSFATIATGGFSTKNDSVAGFSPYIQYVIIVFMFLSGINFSLHYFGFHGRFKKILNNEEFRAYAIIILIISVILSFTTYKFFNSAEHAFRHALFQIVSIITATGFASADYTLWSEFSVLLVFISMFFGACVGSTGGGIKIARYVIVFKRIGLHFRQLVKPNAVNVARYNGNIIEPSTFSSVFAFIFLYGLTFIVGSIFMSILGLDWQSASSSVITTLGGIGPGLGLIGPSNTFVDIPTAGKVYLSLNMIAGRLEIVSFLILFSRSFYKV